MLFTVLAAPRPLTVAAGSVPITGSGDSNPQSQIISHRNSSVRPLPPLDEFVSAVAGGQGERVVGVYVADILALRVLQQRRGNAGYVTSAPDAVSQFSVAASYGTTGLLAHNYLSGEKFFELSAGQTVVVVRADGSRERYRIDSVHRYQALAPSSPVSDFLELDGEGRRVSAQQLFDQMYGRPGQLVFQTCIARDGNSFWGRLFVVATPLEVRPGPDVLVKFQRLLESEF